MELTILGASGSYATAESQCSGYLLRHDGHAVWMDAGNGTLSELQKHIRLGDLDGVFLSHAHPDHCADIYPFFYSVLFAGRAPVPVYTPVGLRDRLESLVGADSVDRFRALFEWRELKPGDVAETGPFRLSVFDASHSALNNTMRIEAGGRTLCYSGDTGPNPDLRIAAAGVDLFLCESSWVNDQRSLMGPIHLAAGETGEAGRASGCARLVLTHIWPTNDREVVRGQAAEAFGSDVELALELGTTTI